MSRSAGDAFLDAEPVEDLPIAESVAGESLAAAPPGTVLLFTSDLTTLIGHFGWQFEDEPIEVRVVQSGDGRRAIVVPVDASGAIGLPTRRYRLTLALARKRWETTDPEDELNTYESSGRAVALAVMQTLRRSVATTTVFSASGWRTKGPGFRGLSLWSVPGSNRRPPACKAGALPAELTPREGSV